jgi:hypothetical protein
MSDVKITHRKLTLPITEEMEYYLDRFGRRYTLPLTYQDLLSFNDCYPLFDREGNPTYWSTVVYPHEMHHELFPKLISIYSLLKTGDVQAVPHIYVERVDFCEFGNSKPFRVRVVNQYNDNYDHIYVKTADASRIYGLEFEHLLSPNRINYLAQSSTLIEEHIAGVPGDVFIREYLSRPDLNKVRIAKEFVKFSERCFIRLLGDMRSYNYVIDMTPDFEEVQYRVRAIDFDQQSYEGKRTIYQPNFFKENLPVVNLCTSCLNLPTMQQYQEEERTLISRRYSSEQQRIVTLIDCMKANPREPKAKVTQLATELAEFHKNQLFLKCDTMAEIMEAQLDFLLSRNDF